MNYNLFKSFFKSEKVAGFILIACTAVSLILSNSSNSEDYTSIWHTKIDLSFSFIKLNYTLEHWINDGLMAIFFLLVGLEIERELYIGELSNIKNALLPILAAIGGMLFPALIHFSFNNGTPTQSGFGIPMATDIAFALGILSLVGKSVPLSLKIFLTALAIIDDLGAITVIALFYSKGVLIYYLLSAIGVFLILFIAGKKKIYNINFYILGGIIMWYLMIKSGIHASIAGVLLAFAIPFHKEDHKNPSFKLQHRLHYPVAFVILPIFALANTAISIPSGIGKALYSYNSLGIVFGLLIGKFIGIFVVSYIAVKSKIAFLSTELTWGHIFGISLLGGIGFTMSIFITNLAFSDAETIVISKVSVMIASFIAAILGLIVLMTVRRRNTITQSIDQ